MWCFVVADPMCCCPECVSVGGHSIYVKDDFIVYCCKRGVIVFDFQILFYDIDVDLQHGDVCAFVAVLECLVCVGVCLCV